MKKIICVQIYSFYSESQNIFCITVTKKSFMFHDVSIICLTFAQYITNL